MIKVLHVITSLQRDGAQTVLAGLVSATAARFNHVVVSLRDEGYFGAVLRADGIPVHVLGLGGHRGAMTGIAGLTRIVRSEKPDLIQTWLYHADLLGGLAAQLAGAPPVVWGIHHCNLDVTAIGRSTRLVAWLSARLSGLLPDAIACCSFESARVHAAFGYRAERFRVIPNGCDPVRFRPNPGLRQATREQLGVTSGTLLCGMVARWDPQKDHANLFRAMQHVTARRTDLRLLLVGTGMVPTNPKIKALVKETGLEGRVILAGPRDDVPAIMNALDLHILSSLSEAFGVVVAEAMACGTPCVVTNVGDTPKIVGDTGWVARPHDPFALSEAICTALAALEREGREALGRKARGRITKHFTLAQMSEAYTALWLEFAQPSA